MSLNDVLSQYGYLAVFIGSILEGETILILAGYFIHQGYILFTLTVICAAIGGTAGDQLFFFLGRYYGDAFLNRFPHLKGPVERVNKLIEKHHTSLIIGVRFMYGLRIAGPIALGMSKIPIHRFVLLNVLGSFLWAILIVSIGYVFGQTLEWLFDDLKKYEELGLAIIAVLVVTFILLRRKYKKSLH